MSHRGGSRGEAQERGLARRPNWRDFAQWAGIPSRRVDGPTPRRVLRRLLVQRARRVVDHRPSAPFTLSMVMAPFKVAARERALAPRRAVWQRSCRPRPLGSRTGGAAPATTRHCRLLRLRQRWQPLPARHAGCERLLNRHLGPPAPSAARCQRAIRSGRRDDKPSSPLLPTVRQVGGAEPGVCLG